VYARRAAERELTFDFADGLLDNNLLIVDRETGSVWSQLHGKAVIGQLEGTPLEIVPSVQTTWKFWRERHPDTRVMVLPDAEGRPYFYRNRPTATPSSEVGRQTEHDATALGLGIVVGGEALWASLRDLENRELPVEMTLGGQRIRLGRGPGGPTPAGGSRVSRGLVRRFPRLPRCAVGRG
jgi:hypothetical protein